MSLVILVSMMIFGLVMIGCIPAIESSNHNRDAEEAATVEIAPDQITEEPINAEPSPAPITEEPSQPVNEETQTVEPPTNLADVVYSDPSEVDNTELPITSLEGLHTTGRPPEVNIEKYKLRVEGLVETPLSLTYEELLSYLYVTEVVLLICPSIFADNAEWTGIPVARILEDAGIKPEATEIVFKAMKEPPFDESYKESKVVYTKQLPLEDIMGNNGIYLAHTVNGQALPLEHGYPLRLVAKGLYGSYWVKWFEIIEVR